MSYTVRQNTRGILNADGTHEFQDRKMSKAYRVIRPDNTMRKLVELGYTCKILDPKESTMGMSRGWEHVLDVRPGDVELPGGYEAVVSILFNHKGSSSVRLMPNAWRQSCANEFWGAPIRIHHCSKAADEFLANPDRYVEQTLVPTRQVARNVESLRGVRLSNLWNWLYTTHPRLWKKALEHGDHYRRLDGVNVDTVWAFLQCLTEVKSSTLQGYVQSALSTTEGFTSLREGRAPAAWLN